jgi:orsellinic acid C2-O-methyltransferase
VTPADRAFELINGFRATQLVRTAITLNIPDLLAGAGKTAGQLSEATGVDAGRLRRFMRGLAALGVVVEELDGRFANTEVGELFREGIPGSRRPMALMLVPESYNDWEHLTETLRTGVTGHALAHGGTLWETIERDSDFAARFNAAMVSNTEGVGGFVAASADFSGTSMIVDVGGGLGGLAVEILQAHPHVRATICDLAAGLAETPQYVARNGVSDRCSIVEADFFSSLPEGGDVYLLRRILHDWDDRHAAAILSVCRRAMSAGARLMVVERLMPARITADPSNLNPAFIDLQMMVQLGGQERTVDEYKRLLDKARFKFTRAVPGTVYSLLEAVAT